MTRFPPIPPEHRALSHGVMAVPEQSEFAREIAHLLERFPALNRRQAWVLARLRMFDKWHGTERLR